MRLHAVFYMFGSIFKRMAEVRACGCGLLKGGKEWGGPTWVRVARVLVSGCGLRRVGGSGVDLQRLPFELRAVEGALSIVRSGLEAEADALEDRTVSALRRLLYHRVDRQNLSIVRHSRLELVRLSSRTQALRKVGPPRSPLLPPSDRRHKNEEEEGQEEGKVEEEVVKEDGCGGGGGRCGGCCWWWCDGGDSDSDGLTWTPLDSMTWRG